MELLHKFQEAIGSPDDTQILPEDHKINLTVRRRPQSVLLELKTTPTNYGRGGGKPITNFIDGVVNDLVKLAKQRGPSDTGLVAWLAYVIPEPVPKTWPDHVAKVQAAAAKTLRAERMLLWGNAFANLYILKSK